jgi:hypothetical protein
MSTLCGLRVHGRRTLTLLALLAAAPVACSGNPTWTTCSLCTTSALVRGTVRDTLGSPAAGAKVDVQVSPDSCGGSPVGIVTSDSTPVPTDSTGHYRYLIRTTFQPFPACVSAKARLVADTMYGADTVVTGRLLQFKLDYPAPAGEPHDSMTIDLVLRHR